MKTRLQAVMHCIIQRPLAGMLVLVIRLDIIILQDFITRLLDGVQDQLQVILKIQQPLVEELPQLPGIKYELEIIL